MGEGSATFLPDERGTQSGAPMTAVEQAPVNTTVTPEQSGDAPTTRRRREDQQAAMDPRIQELIATLTQRGRYNDALQRLEELAREAEEARRND
jgi:phage gp29-like protein